MLEFGACNPGMSALDEKNDKALAMVGRNL
jgi:hypothetical protein